MTGQIIKKVVQKLKRPKEEWYFVATETFERFHFLLGLAPAYNFSQCDKFKVLLFGHNLGDIRIWLINERHRKWQAFQDEIELRFGRIVYDSSSTLATTDDNPGTGRLIDKFVYQPIGQSIERLFLALEIRYFNPPEKNAYEIRRFLDRSEYFGDLVSVEEIFDHELFNEVHCLNEVDFKEECVSLFLEISRKEKVAKAFQRLLMQASSKKRSLRVEAQKQIWSLLRYKNMVFVLNAFTDLENLMWDGYTTTFQHCSPLDPDFQTHFLFVMKMHLLPDVLVDISSSSPFGMLCISTRDILETCARENRGFSSLPINLVIELLTVETYEILNHEEKLAENLYLALIAITGFCNEFSYASDFLTEQVTRCFCDIDFCMRMRPFWKKDRTESDINALELMVHFMIYSIISIPGSISEASATNGLEYCIALLNDADKGQGTMSKLEAKASEDYLRKVTEGLVQRGPISFAMFKDIVANPLIREVYHRPERGTEAKGKSRASTTWEYELCIDIDYSLKPPILSCRAIPFSDNFGDQHIDGLFQYIKWEIEEEDFAGPVDAWFRIQKRLEELKDNSMTLPCDGPDTGSPYWRVMDWWRSYNIQYEMSRVAWYEHSDPGNRAQPFPRNDGEATALPSPCQCRICKRSSHMTEKVKDGTPQPSVKIHYVHLRTENVPLQYRHQHSIATESSPLTSCPGILKRKLEEEEPNCSQLVSDTMQNYPSYQRRSSPKLKLEGGRTPHFGTKDVSATQDSPCLCSECEQLQCIPRKNESVATRPALTGFTSPSRKFEAHSEVERVPAGIEEHTLPHQTDNVSSQHRRQHNTATVSSPFISRPGFLKRKLEELEPRAEIVPLPRRYRDNTAEDAEPRSSLGPVRKKQRTSLSLESDTSDADAIITEVDKDSTESDTGSEDAMSVDEDFRSAKSKLSLLAIED